VLADFIEEEYIIYDETKTFAGAYRRLGDALREFGGLIYRHNLKWLERPVAWLNRKLERIMR